MKKLTAIVIGAGGRGMGYTKIMHDMEDKFELVGIAEPVPERVEFELSHFPNVPKENIYDTWEKILDRPKFADFALIATQDQMHIGPALKAIELGYDILLEKPIAPTEQECVDSSSIGGLDSVSIMDEIVPEIDEDIPSQEYGEIENELSLESVREEEDMDDDDEDEEDR